MRIISGKYKGKKLEGFDIIGTRPTKDRVKESIFGMIQNKINGSVFLDLFAGCGSIGIEAISNKAKISYFVDNGKEILKVLNNNLKGIENYKVIDKDYKASLKYFKQNNILFDIIYIDPPYHLNMLNSSIALIEEYELLKEDGILICEYEEENPICKYILEKNKKYGKTNINVYRKK